MRRSRARAVALGGVFGALSLVFLLAGGAVPVGTFAAPIFAGICLLPVAIEAGAKWALLCYAAASALGLLAVADLELVFFYIALFGWYPIAQPVLGRLRLAAVRYALKLLLFYAAVAAVYFFGLVIFALPALREELAGYAPGYAAALLALGGLTFLVYDRLLTRLRPIYIARFRLK